MTVAPAATADEERIRAIAFVLRCAGAAVFAYLLATWLGLDHPIWATVSGLVVSQDRLGDTRRSLVARIVATAVGIAVAIVMGTGLAWLAVPQAVALGMVVAVCAALTRWRADLRITMWTSAIVLLTGAGQPVWHTGLARGVEVLIGCLVGAAMHQLAEGIVDRWQRRVRA